MEDLMNRQADYVRVPNSGDDIYLVNDKTQQKARIYSSSLPDLKTATYFNSRNWTQASRLMIPSSYKYAPVPRIVNDERYYD